MFKIFKWHQDQLKWWQEKFNLSNYAILWVAFIKRMLIGLLIYHFFY